MKTILFLCRAELTDLYVALGRTLQKKFHVVYLPYNAADEMRLAQYGVPFEESFVSRHRRSFSPGRPSRQNLDSMDAFIIGQTNGRFCLNSALQSDRSYAGWDYDETLAHAWTSFRIWQDFFAGRRIDLAFHEPVSLFFNQMAELHCKARGGEYLTFISAAGLPKFGFLILDAGNAAAPEIVSRMQTGKGGGVEPTDAQVDSFLAGFRTEYKVFLSSIIRKNDSYCSFFMRGLLRRGRQLLTKGAALRLTDPVDYFLNHSNPHWEKLGNKWDYARKLVYDKPDERDDYYYYSLHLEPEAVVLYWGDGFYTNQVKLIENIAAQLPPGRMLYVKDHPHILCYRAAEDYLRLQRIPNVKVLDPSIPGKALTANARGVFSINATAGFEALLMQKEVYIVGNAFYDACPLVKKVRNIRDLREMLYNAPPWDDRSEAVLRTFVTAYLGAVHEGVTDYFGGRIGKYPVDLEENSRRIASAVCDYVEQREKNNG